MDKIRVLVSDSEVLFREGVRALLKIYKDIEVVGVVTSGEEAIEMAKEKAPDVVLVNIAKSIMNDVEVIRHIRKENDEIRVLLVSQYEDRGHILTGLKAGVHGYILKRATASELVSAIRVVYEGGYFLYPSVAKTVVDDYFQRIRLHGKGDPYERLTHREKEILKLITEGRKSGEIANLLNISVRTVQSYRTNMMRKLGIHNRAQFIEYAVGKQLINQMSK